MTDKTRKQDRTAAASAVRCDVYPGVTCMSRFDVYPDVTCMSRCDVYPGVTCVQSNPTLDCNIHARFGEVLDHWLNIEEVALVLYSGGWDVKFVVLDGRGSNFVNWLSPDRVLRSSWSDLKTEAKNFFSIVGDAVNYRHFFLNSIYGGCDVDEGWLVTVDQPHPNCEWERSDGGGGGEFDHSVRD
ncbi:uncharacterized protein LOC118478619 [Aplysia californica]|uniref:Uncharacterized protein LOC118478619 n=1 Tax=Aplysia californica TaxID=6500 RepID=A0ABM1W1C5_APLCA|nr:uncharacterized protein LOC118478619 [Aplysia californica]